MRPMIRCRVDDDRRWGYMIDDKMEDKGEYELPDCSRAVIKTNDLFRGENHVKYIDNCILR